MQAGRVLVVEDDRMIRQLYGAILGARGHEMLEAADGDSAFPVARAARPDLVLLDVGLPGLDGFGVLRQLKGDPELRDTPVIMVTACADPPHVARATMLGAHDFVRKPFDVEDLGDRVDAALAGSGR